MIEWKWTKGEPYERSRRIVNKENVDVQFDVEEHKSTDDLAYSCSLNHDENTWELLNQSLIGNDFRQINKREDTDKRLSERQMVSQINMNPYLVNNNYVDDIETRDTFLKPISTNQEREKSNQNE
jgi:hypothetical protein